MGAILVPVIVVVVLLVIASVLFTRLRQHGEQQREEVLAAPHRLRYTVPTGQDPAAALVSLSRGGFEATADPGDQHALVIMCPLGSKQREEVRLLLERETANTLEGQERGGPQGDPPPPEASRVRFADEQ